MQNLTADANQMVLTHEQFESMLKEILSATAGRFGDAFLSALVKELSYSLTLDAVVIAKCCFEEQRQAEILACFINGDFQKAFALDAKSELLREVVTSGPVAISDCAQTQYPDESLLKDLSAEAFFGVALKDSHGKDLGVLFATAKKAVHHIALTRSLLQIFSFRIASELERQSISRHLEQEVVVNQAQLDSVPALMFMLDEEGRFLRWNRYFSSKFGYSRDRMTRESVFGAVHPTDRRRLELELKAIFETGAGTIYLSGLTRDGSSVPLLATAQTAQYEGRQVVVGVALDMTEQQNVERNLLRSQGRLAKKNSQLSLINALVEKLHASHSVKHIAEEIVKLLKNIHEGALVLFSLLETSGEQLEIIASGGVKEQTIAARRHFPVGQKGSPTGLAMTSGKLEVFKDIESDERLDPEIKELILGEGIKCGIVIPLIYPSEPIGGITIGYRYNSEFPRDELEFYQTIGTSVSLAVSNARQFELMEKLATHDNLTQLPNRNALNQDCKIALNHSLRQGYQVGLILVDLDRFKEINDTLDHQIGDKLLQKLGPRIQQTLKDENCKVYRLGGDEFCVLVERVDSDEDVMAIATMINLAIAKPFEVDGLNLEINSSIGISVSRSIQRNANEMLRCAELAMYQAKNDGVGIVEYTTSLDADTNQRFVIMAEMAEAIRNDDLILHYQAKFDLATRRIIGCEALVRWHHKNYGLLPPTKFIPLVELTQLIHPLTYWVMKSSMAQMQKWKSEGIDIKVAINLSTRNLVDSDFIEQVDELIKTYQINPGNLEFEVTETALMSNMEGAKNQLKRLSKRGIRCSLDDYGTGYSSLSYLKNLPLDILKIDRTFISRLTENSQDKVIAHSTINLAHSLGLKVVAEGVEDELTMHELARQGCDFIQGYYISEPLDAESFARLYWEHA